MKMIRVKIGIKLKMRKMKILIQKVNFHFFHIFPSNNCIISIEEADETAEKVNVSAEGEGAAEEESPTRGKKRKHEGD